MKSTKVFAPVFIPTLCRYEHFKNCVESLSRCSGANNTDLLIALDYPLKEEHWEGYLKIKKYVQTIPGFKSVVVWERDHNYGVSENIEASLGVIFDKYCRYIFSEDDNIFSPNFLIYMNEGLEKYKDNPSVYSISGYNYPIDMSKYKKNIYAHYQFSAWGVGFWRKKKITCNYAKELFKPLKNKIKLLLKDPIMFLYFLLMSIRHENYGDTSYVIASIINNWVSIFPSVSKVRNLGNDGSGQHGWDKKNTYFEMQEIDKESTFAYDEIPLKCNYSIPLNRYFKKDFWNMVLRHLHLK